MLILGVFVLLLSSDLSAYSRRFLSDLGIIAAALGCAAACNHRRTQFTGRRRRAWGLFAAAAAVTAGCNVFILGVHLLRQPDSVIVYLAPAFLVALSCGIVGLGQYSTTPRRRTDLARLICDCIVTSCSLFLVSVVLFPTSLGTSANNPIARLLPLVDVVVVTFAVLIFVRVTRADRVVLGLLCGGAALYAVVDFAVFTSPSGYAYGSPLDVGWMAGYMLIALAALHPAASRPVTAGSAQEVSPILGTAIMFALASLAVAFALLQNSPILGSTSRWLWLVILLALAARQFLLMVDNDTLRRGLQRMVADRTLELEHAINQSELLLASVGEGIYGVDRSGLVTFINPAGARTLGSTPELLVGSHAHSTFHALRGDGTPWPAENCYITQAITLQAVSLAEEDSYRRADGRTFPVEVTATPLTSDDHVRGAVVVFRDITQRLEVDRLKTEFVSMVSHELRTPLTSIRGSLGLLAGSALGPMPAGALRLVTLALDSCARLTRLINDILDIERIESDTMPMVAGDHPASELVDAAVAQLQILATQVDVILLAHDVEGTVHADPDRVVQTLINLLDNAIKFSPPNGTVEVTSRADGTVVEFQVTDRGRGIPSEKLDQIFSRFEQVDSSDAREKGGSGLGLAISRSVVERLGGRIWAESIEGDGATFRFTLPRAERPAESLAAVGPASPRLSE